MKKVLLTNLLISTVVLSACGGKKSDKDGKSSPNNNVRWTEDQKVEAKEFYTDALEIAFPSIDSDRSKQISTCIFDLVEPRFTYKEWEEVAGEGDVSDAEVQECVKNTSSEEVKKEEAGAVVEVVA